MSFAARRIGCQTLDFIKLNLSMRYLAKHFTLVQYSCTVQLVIASHQTSFAVAMNSNRNKELYLIYKPP